MSNTGIGHTSGLSGIGNTSGFGNGNYVRALQLRGEALEAEDEEGVQEHDREVDQRGTSLTRKRTPLGPYRRPMPRVPGGT